MRLTTLAVAVAFAASSVGSVRAQSKVAVGVEGGALSGSGESLFQLGLRAMPSRGGYGSVDFTFATFPDPLLNGTFVFLMDLGATYGAPRDSSPVFVFPHGGVSLLSLVGLSSGGGGAEVGIHVGAGLLVLASPRIGVTVDYTYRRLSDVEVPLSSITFGLMFMH
jgi:hypothetical protein